MFENSPKNRAVVEYFVKNIQIYLLNCKNEQLQLIANNNKGLHISYQYVLHNILDIYQNNIVITHSRAVVRCLCVHTLVQLGVKNYCV